MQLQAQGTTQSSCEAICCPLQGQGATEYLVLLAVVLIVALVSVALLGFFPGMASDAQITQSQTYWRSASPIAVTEWAASAINATYMSATYINLRNTGTYPIRITKLLADGGNYITIYGCYDVSCGPNGNVNISDFYYLAPGEEKHFYTWVINGYVYSLMQIGIGIGTSGGNNLGGASSICSMDAPYGTLMVKNFGFEYIEYIDGQQITKRQVGAAPLVIKCKRSDGY